MSEQPLAYETGAPNDYRWTSAAYDALLSGDLKAEVIERGGVHTARIDGPCPRCGDEVHFSLILDAVTGERSGTLGNDTVSPQPDDSYVTVAAACRCGSSHDGRPEGVHYGCGINFIVEIEVP